MDRFDYAAGEAANGGARAESPAPLSAIEDLKSQGARFVYWKYQRRPGGDGVVRLAKLPYTPDGSSRGWTDPAKWGTFQECLEKGKADGAKGLGFVFNGDGIEGVDIDGCRNPATGEIAPWALERIRALNSYTEISPSGTGVKIFYRTQTPAPFGKKRREVEGEAQIQGKDPGLELFSRQGYFTLTGHHLEGTPKTLNDATDAGRRIAGWLTEHEPKAEAAPRKEVDPRDPYASTNDWASKHLDTWVPPLFEGAVSQDSTGGYRVSSASLGRDLQEDIGITPMGIVDWGMADHPDETRQGKRTAIDLVMEFGDAANATQAARWLAEHMGIEEEFEAKLKAWHDRAEEDFAEFIPTGEVEKPGSDGARKANGTADETIKRHKARKLSFVWADDITLDLDTVDLVEGVLPRNGMSVVYQGRRMRSARSMRRVS